MGKGVVGTKRWERQSRCSLFGFTNALDSTSALSQQSIHAA